MIVVLEGLDGAGKTLVAQQLPGFTYRHFPVDVDLTLPQPELQLAMFRDMITHTRDMAYGNWVIDRYWQSSYVYGMPPELLAELIYSVPVPSFNILLDISPEESIRRCHQAEDKNSRWDTASLDKKRLWHMLYHRMNWDLILDTETLTPEQTILKVKELVYPQGITS